MRRRGRGAAAATNQKGNRGASGRSGRGSFWSSQRLCSPSTNHRLQRWPESFFSLGGLRRCLSVPARCASFRATVFSCTKFPRLLVPSASNRDRHPDDGSVFAKVCPLLFRHCLCADGVNRRRRWMVGLPKKKSHQVCKKPCFSTKDFACKLLSCTNWPKQMPIFSLSPMDSTRGSLDGRVPARQRVARMLHAHSTLLYPPYRTRPPPRTANCYQNSLSSLPSLSCSICGVN